MSCSASPPPDASSDSAAATRLSDLALPAEVACHWWQMLNAPGLDANNAEAQVTVVPANAADALAHLTRRVLEEGKTLLLLVPDDEFLPAISNTLDIGVRPLCLVLPSAEFVARIAMRATLSLMKSRITRDGDDDQGPEWRQQRARVNQLSKLWQQAQEWNSSNARCDWPRDVPELFPVRILPIAAFRAQPRLSADFTVCFCCDLGVDTTAHGGRHLFIGGRAESNHRRSLASVDETTRLTVELAQLVQDVGELELELATAQAEMGEFTRRYYAQIGRRMTELDVLKAKLARVQLEKLQRDIQTGPQTVIPGPQNIDAACEKAQTDYEALFRQAERSREESRRFAEAEQEPEQPAHNKPFRPDAQVKRLFRQLAQRIHPDRASSDHDRAWRTQLMSEANRAYRSGDIEALREVAALWDEGAEQQSRASVARADTSVAPQEILRRQIAAMRQRFESIRGELHRLFGSRLYELFLAARQVRRAGRDLLQEMADRLDTQIDEIMGALGLTPPAAL